MYHHDPKIFPEPEVFRPERWLVSDEEFNKLERYMMPFSRGSRMCVAMKYVSLQFPYICSISIFPLIAIPSPDHFDHPSPPLVI